MMAAQSRHVMHCGDSHAKAGAGEKRSQVVSLFFGTTRTGSLTEQAAPAATHMSCCLPGLACLPQTVMGRRRRLKSKRCTCDAAGAAAEAASPTAAAAAADAGGTSAAGPAEVTRVISRPDEEMPDATGEAMAWWSSDNEDAGGYDSGDFEHHASAYFDAVDPSLEAMANEVKNPPNSRSLSLQAACPCLLAASNSTRLCFSPFFAGCRRDARADGLARRRCTPSPRPSSRAGDGGHETSSTPVGLRPARSPSGPAGL